MKKGELYIVNRFSDSLPRRRYDKGDLVIVIESRGNSVTCRVYNQHTRMRHDINKKRLTLLT